VAPPQTPWGAHSAPPDPSWILGGPTSKGRERRERGRGREGEEGSKETER